MYFRFLIFTIACLCVFTIHDAFAAAWTLKKEEKRVINTVSYYTTKTSFDNSGKKISQDSFTKIENNIYAEYGIMDYLTVGLSQSFQYLEQKNESGKIWNSGPTDTEIFVRNLLLIYDTSVFSLQPLIKIPGFYSEEQEPRLGNKQVDLEIRGLFGHGFLYDGKDHFANLELAYRRRMEEPGDEVRFDATLGLRPRGDILVLLQSFNTLSVNSSSAASGLQLANSTDFNANKIQVSVVKTLSDKYSLQIGGFQTLRGKNTGAGGGVMLSLWTNF